MKYVAIDIGSSFVKSALLDLDAHTISHPRKAAQAEPLPSPGRRFEVDGEAMFRRVKELLDSYLEQFGGEIRGVLLSTQMHGFILAGADGMAVTPYISWQDERCLEEMEPGLSYIGWLEQHISRQEMEDVGVYLKPMMGLCNLFTLLRQGFQPPEGTQFCTIGSYMILRLTGQNVCHLSNASPTGFADAKHCRWAEHLIRKAGAQQLRFPRLTGDMEICGHYHWKGLSIPVYPDVGDQQAGALGSLARPETDAIINIGTGATLGLISPHFQVGSFETRPFFDGHYLYTLSRLPGGRNLAVLIHFLQKSAQAITGQPVTENQVWEAVGRSLTRLDSRGLTVDCSFYKTETADCGHIGGIYYDNLELSTLFSAALEDMARTHAAALERICPGKAGLQRLVFSGGMPGRLPLLRQALQQCSGISRSAPPIADEVMVGHFRLALQAAGRCSRFQDSAAMVQDGEGNCTLTLLP